MSIKVIDDTKLTAIGNAIRTKAGTALPIDIDDMPQAIANIPTGGFDWSQVTGLQFKGVPWNKPTLDVSGIDTSGFNDMYNMFGGIGMNMTAITGLTSFDTSNVQTMRGMFTNDTGLSTLNLSSFNTSNVTIMQEMFSGCTNLTSVTLGEDFDTSRVTSFTSLFYNCKKLDVTTVAPLLDVASCANFSYMFYGCFDNTDYPSGAGTALDLSGWDTHSGTNMAYMFQNCKKMTALDVTGWDVDQVTSIGYMFSGCSSLTHLDLSSFDTSKCSSLAYMFSGCSGLESLNLSNLSTGRIGNQYSIANMFYGCSSLTDIIWSQRSSVQNIMTAPSNLGITSTMKFYVPDDLVDTYKAATNWSTISDQIYSINDLPAALKTRYGIS